MTEPRYHTANIREFLTRGFDVQELRLLCYDDPELRPAVDELSDDMGRTQTVRTIIEFCERRLLLDRLLDRARTANPSRYGTHGPYTYDEDRARPARQQTQLEPASLRSAETTGRSGYSKETSAPVLMQFRTPGS